MALAVSTLARNLSPPLWLDPLGTWLAIAVLTLLACINLTGAVQAPRHATAHLSGWRTSLFPRFLHAGTAATILCVGVVFALSFETLSQASLFATVATKHRGWQPAFALAALFVLGMAFTDGANGMFISELIRRSDQGARLTSRIMALAVSGVSLLVAGLGAAGQLIPGIDDWRADIQLWFGAAVVTVIVGSYLLGTSLARGHPEGKPGAPKRRSAESAYGTD